MLTYPGVIDLPRATLDFLTGLLVDDHDRRRTWRKLPPERQALLVLAHLRHGDTYERLAAGFEVSVGTVHNYLREAVELLVTRGRSLLAAVWTFAWTRSNFLILDGTVVRTNRVRALNRLYYSGKHKYHGINLQGLTDPHGRLLWISDGLPGSTHDLTAARAHHILDTVDRAELYLYADKGYVGGEGTRLLVPHKKPPKRDLTDQHKNDNRAHAATRSPGERGFAVLKNWHIFDRYRGCPRRVGNIAQAVLVLTENQH
ncbi:MULTISPECIES: transposase family protein [Frankia]|uniref:Transposase family protein n=1 Tax=Frankia umida TaxID=573489 RepID=A0ABT0K4U7_9ACTN|nr:MULTISPECIES: transposase family protein [Frankia]MCK9878343.1 transposase family protein [Frankia umida]MCK9897944.1 transposase family protein [Frankia sp. AgB32]